MEIIKNYLDNVFAGYPQTNEIQALKQDMLTNMEDKYTALRDDGKSEHESAYSIIANFGNIEEIATELGLNAETSDDIEEAISLNWDEAKTYLEKSKRSGLLTGFGVGLIISGVSSVVLFDNPFILFLTIAISITLFIKSGYKMEVYKSYAKTFVHLDTDTRERIEKDYDEFKSHHINTNIIGAVLIILSIGAFTIIEFPVTLFLNIVGLSIFLFITSGYQNSAFNILLGKGDYSNKEANEKYDRILGTFSVIYWLIVVTINLFLLFVVNTPQFWVIWPIAGVLFGAICTGISVWCGTEEKF